MNPTLDRFWWLRLFGLIPIIALVALMVFLFVSDVQHPPTDANTHHVELFILFVLAVGLWPYIRWIFGARAARDRWARRKAAIAGDQGAIPTVGASVSADQVDGEQANTVEMPLVLQWHVKKGMRRFFLPILVMFFIIFCAFLLLLPGLMLYELLSPNPVNIQQPISHDWGGILECAFFAYMEGMILFALVMTARAIYTMSGKPFGVTATTEGITVRPVNSWRARMMGWDEMRLLELVAKNGRETYWQYSSHKSIAWPAEDGQQAFYYEPVNMSYSAMRAGHQQLLALIRARTGLIPRTFNERLQRRQTNSADNPTVYNLRVSRGNKFLGFAIMAVLLLIPTVLVFVPGVTTSFALNIVLALPIASVFIALIIISLRRPASTISISSAGYMLSLQPSEALDTDYTPDKRYTLSYAPTIASRLRTGLIGVAFTVEALPVVLPIAAQIPFLPPGWHLPALNGEFGAAAAVFLLFVALLGVLLIIVSLRTNRRTFQVDADGLIVRHGSKTHAYLWESIESVTVGLKNGEPERYSVTLGGAPANITWPAHPKKSIWTAPADADYTMVAQELAAVITWRSGKRLHVIDVVR